MAKVWLGLESWSKGLGHGFHQVIKVESTTIELQRIRPFVCKGSTFQVSGETFTNSTISQSDILQLLFKLETRYQVSKRLLLFCTQLSRCPSM